MELHAVRGVRPAAAPLSVTDYNDKERPRFEPCLWKARSWQKAIGWLVKWVNQKEYTFPGIYEALSLWVTFFILG